MPSATLKVARIQHGYRIRIEGRGTAEESPALAAFVSQCLTTQQQDRILIDLSGCEYLDSTFLGCLVTLSRDYQKAKEGRIQFLADAGKQELLLRPTCIDSLLTFADGEPQNVSDYVTMDRAKLSKAQFGRHMLESHRALAGVPSEYAQLFQEIADQLERELQDREKYAGKPGSVRETV